MAFWLDRFRREDEEDIWEELKQMLKNSDKYEERGSFKSWICTVAKNVSKDYLKSASFRNMQNTTSDEVVLSIIPEKKETPDSRALAQERQARIIDAIETLKPKLREVIMLCEINGYTYEELSFRDN